ncbi:aquaporin-11-like [Paramacrobiotus metropolitanus]|uniref:aquaporin-11-like n=1 Tax=Paramacrobiotus metropolitanus TaxID=2943436 RepID=UPI0024459A5C|nr:aquaporin-11-like [Paramacrobiotus metropolitanus]
MDQPVSDVISHAVAHIPYLSETPWLFYLVEVLITSGIVRFLQEFIEQSRVSVFIEEFFCILQLIILSHENLVIQKAYGDLAFAVVLLLSCYLYGRTFRTGVFTNVAGNVHVYAFGNYWPWGEFVGHIVTQLLASYCGYWYVRFVWAVAATDAAHKGKLSDIQSCSSHIQINTAAAVAVEMALTFLFRLMIHRENRFRSGLVLVSLMAVAMTFAGWNLTGGYFNPSLAFSMEFNCSGHNHLQFFLVYFLGPIIAAFIVGKLGDKIWSFVPHFFEDHL